MLISDNCTSHKGGEVQEILARGKTVNVLIPPGCTSFVQWLDTSFFALFKSLYRKRYNEFLLTDESQKVSASRRRVLMTKWVADSFAEALTKLSPNEGFRQLGYFWENDDSYAPKIRDLDYSFDPALIPLPPAVIPAPKPKPAAKSSHQASLRDYFRRA